MMRSGRLLAEDSPENLLRDTNLSSLENVFLELCIKNNDNKFIPMVAKDASLGLSTVFSRETDCSEVKNLNFLFFSESIINFAASFV